MNKILFCMLVGPDIAQVQATVRFDRDPIVRPTATVRFNDPHKPEIQVDCPPLRNVSDACTLMTSSLLRAVTLEARRVASRVRYMAGKSKAPSAHFGDLIACTNCEALFQVNAKDWKPGIVGPSDGIYQAGYVVYCPRCKGRVDVRLVDDVSAIGPRHEFKAPPGVAEGNLNSWFRSVDVPKVYDHMRKVFPPANNATNDLQPTGHGFYVRKRGSLGIEVAHCGVHNHDENVLDRYEKHLASKFAVRRTYQGLSCIPHLYVFPRERKAPARQKRA